jgi:hypothetical protein
MNVLASSITALPWVHPTIFEGPWRGFGCQADYDKAVNYVVTIHVIVGSRLVGRATVGSESSAQICSFPSESQLYKFRFQSFVEIVKVLKCKVLLLRHIRFCVDRLTALFRVQHLRSLPTFRLPHLIQFRVHVSNFDILPSRSAHFSLYECILS